MALDTNLVAYYKFDENTGTSVGDSVGTKTGTFNGSGTKWATGKINSGGNFVQASSHYVNIPGFNNIMNYAAMSMSVWGKFTSFPSDSRVCGNSDTGANNGGIMLSVSNTQGKFYFTVGNGTARGQANFSGITTATWYHMVGTYDGANVKLYINNVIGTSATLTGSINAVATDLNIGRQPAYGGVDYVNGVIDEVGIWNRALTSAEVGELYNSGAGFQYPFTATANTTNFFSL